MLWVGEGGDVLGGRMKEGVPNQGLIVLVHPSVRWPNCSMAFDREAGSMYTGALDADAVNVLLRMLGMMREVQDLLYLMDRV